MRNLKKILALVLALVMSFSVMTVSSAAFADQDKVSETYTEAVDVLSALNVFKGDTEGNFNPEKTITRKEVAAIIYRITTGDVNDEHFALYAGMNLFTDVAADDWYAGYVNYCAATGYIKGYEGKFNPDLEVNGVQALAMILRAVGYDKNGEFSGMGWDARVKTYAVKAGVLGNLSNINLGANATREVVAQILFNAINVPQVTYSVLTGEYINYSNPLTHADELDMNATLAEQNFGLICVAGQITAVGRLAGTTEINLRDEDHKLTNIKWTVKNTTTSWELIGHDAHIWATKTNKPYVAAAITEAYIDSSVVYEGTDGTDLYTLTTYGYVAMDANYEVYYNGVKQTTVSGQSGAINKLAEVGVKGTFICNDFGGKADVLVVTEYTPATVTNIATDIMSGVNGTKKNTYTFDYTTTMNTLYVVYEGTVEKNALYTYVDYAGDRYLTDVAYEIGTFTKMNRVLDYGYEYIIGGNTYIKAHDAEYGYFATAEDVLVRGNLLSNVMLILDQYGYILYAEKYTAPSEYLYVFENEETHKKLTEAVVVFLDGTVETVKVASVDGAVYFDDSTDETNYANDHFAGKVYTYKVTEDGNYVLKTATDVTYTPAALYIEGESDYGTYGVNNTTTLVDVRADYADYYLGNVYVGHRGENRIPSITGMTTISKVGAYGWISWGFIVGGYDYAATNKSDDFIVYSTIYNDVERDYYGNYWYYMDVIKDGVLVEDYKLSAALYADIMNYGVGHYVYSKAGELTYTTFSENWKNIIWGKQSLKVDGEFYDYDELPFFVLNIGAYGGAGAAWDYAMVDGMDLGDDVKAYLTYDKYGEVTGIYVIADPSNLADVLDTYYNGYYVAYGEITVKVEGTEKDLMDAIAAFDAASYDYDVAVAKLNAWVKANSAAKAAVTLADLYAAVEEAEAALNAAFTALAEAYEAVDFEIDAAYAAVIENVVNEYYAAIVEASEVIFAANEIVDEIAADVEFKLNIKTVNAVYTVGEDTTVEAVVVAAVEKAANEKAAASAALADLIALGAVVKAEIVEAGEFVDGANEIVVRLTLDLNGELKAIEKTITVNLTIEE